MGPWGSSPISKSFKSDQINKLSPDPPRLSPAMARTDLLYLLPVALLAAVVVYRRLKHWGRSRSFPLPPGPKGYPIIGNVLDIPRGVPLWEGILSLGRQHGESITPWSAETSTISLAPLDTDILYLNFFGKDMIMLNSAKTISDLLDKRSKIYSDKVSVPLPFMCRRVVNGVLAPLAPISYGRPVGPFVLRSDIGWRSPLLPTVWDSTGPFRE